MTGLRPPRQTPRLAALEESADILDLFFTGLLAGRISAKEREAILARNLTALAGQVREAWDTVPAPLQKVQILQRPRSQRPARMSIARRGPFPGIVIWVNRTQLARLRILTEAGGYGTLEDWLLYSIPPQEMSDTLAECKANA